MKEVTLAKMMKYAKRHNIDTDAVLDLWNKDPKLLQDYYYKSLTIPKEPNSEEIMKDFADMGKSFKMKHDYRARPRLDVDNLRLVLEKLRQEVKHKYTDRGLEIVVRISSEFSSNAEEELMVFPPSMKMDDEVIEDTIDQTISALSYEYLINL